MRSSFLSSVFAAGIAVMLATTAFAAGEKTPQGDADDTALALSRGMKTNIEQKEQEIVQNELAVFQTIDQAMEKLQNNNIEAQQETLEGFRRMCDILSALAHKLLTNRNKIVTDADQLNQLNLAAVPIFRKTAVLFQDYSREEPFADIKEDYLALSGAWNSLADLMEKRATLVTDENKGLVEAIHFVERTALFLDRFKKHLDSLPNLQEFSDRENYLQQMEHYIKGMQRFRDQFRKFGTTLRSQALSASLRPKTAAKHPCDIIDKGPRYARQVESDIHGLKSKPVLAPAKKTAMALASKEEESGYSHALLFPFITAPFAIGLIYVPLRCRKQRLPDEKIQVSEAKPKPVEKVTVSEAKPKPVEMVAVSKEKAAPLPNAPLRSLKSLAQSRPKAIATPLTEVASYMCMAGTKEVTDFCRK
jgi:hypothetical protein